MDVPLGVWLVLGLLLELVQLHVLVLEALVLLLVQVMPVLMLFKLC